MGRTIVATKLRELRGSRKRDEVSAAVGVSSSSWGMYEAGLRIPRDETKVRISEYFGISVQDIFY